MFSSLGTDTPCLHLSMLTSAAVCEHLPPLPAARGRRGTSLGFGFPLDSVSPLLLNLHRVLGGQSLPITIQFLLKFHLWTFALLSSPAGSKPPFRTQHSLTVISSYHPHTSTATVGVGRRAVSNTEKREMATPRLSSKRVARLGQV